MFYVYLLRCQDDSLYTGITTDLQRRFLQHSGKLSRGAKYTASRKPVGFAAAWLVPDRITASRLEYHIKALTRAEKDRLISGDALEALDLSPYTRVPLDQTGRKMTMLFLCYPKCSTCQKAKTWLDQKGLSYTLRDIRLEPPTQAELQAWHSASRLPLKRFFNTSGQLYRSLELTKKLPDMSQDEQFQLLASDGMLVKRPILIQDQTVLVGFREAEWEQALIK